MPATAARPPQSVPQRTPEPRKPRGLARGILSFALLCLLAVAGSADAREVRGESGHDGQEPRVAGELLVDASAVQPGDTVRVGVGFEIDPGWHLYWRNPGDSGRATELTWRSDAASFGSTQWPAPHVYREADVLTTFGYGGDVLLASDAVVSTDASGTWRIEVDADFVVCEIQCIPGHIELAREVPIADAAQPPPAEVRARFDRAASRLPRSAEALGIDVAVRSSHEAVQSGDAFLVALDVVSCVDGGDACVPWALDAAHSHEAFVPDKSRALTLSPRGLGAPPVQPGFSVIVSGRAYEDARLDQEQLRGVLPLVRDGRAAHLEIDLPIAAPSADGSVALAPAEAFEVIDPLAPTPVPGEAAAAARSPALSLSAALLLALLGGLVLNLMPCVLPVLALKVFGIAELAHAERGQVARNGLAYFAGVLVSMGVLAAVVVALRAAGASVGWGFQFQEPVFVAAICTLLVVFAMNLFGAFEVTWQPSGPSATPEHGAGSSRRSFFEGALAVALATPCTAPFLGTAVGFAFAAPGAVIFAVFGAIGVGLAAPYLLVTLVPGWSRFVPRPGAWMLRVRAALGFSLLAAVVWLLWVTGRAVGVDAQAVLLGYLVAVAFLVWILGTLQASSRTGAARILAVGILGLVALSLATLPLTPAPRAASLISSADGIDWQPFDPATIARERVAGRPVFVDFTADWCITCKVNETVVLANDAVRDELARGNYATVKADWTLRDEAIGRELAAFGRAGVPMYLVYPSDPGRAPTLLPELLTVDGTIAALRAGASENGT